VLVWDVEGYAGVLLCESRLGLRGWVSCLVFSGRSCPALKWLLSELGESWIAKVEGQRRRWPGRVRYCRVGAGRAGRAGRFGYEDRVLVMLVVLRFQFPYACLAVVFGVDRAMMTRAVHRVRSLLVARGFQTPGRATASYAGTRVLVHEPARDPAPGSTGPRSRSTAHDPAVQNVACSCRGMKKQNTITFTIDSLAHGPCALG
jgi:hypothetical protein